MTQPDAVVIGSGPNGLAAAITLARAGLKVTVYEAAALPGGGMRSEELTQPGVIHDVCSAVHPLAVASPAFQSFQLERFGLEWIQPPVPAVHPLDGGHAVRLERDVYATAAGLGADEKNYIKAFEKYVQHVDPLLKDVLAPLHVPLHPWLYARFGLKALHSAEAFVQRSFRTREAQALFAGVAAHSSLRLDAPLSAAVGLMLSIAGHAYGWPIPRGGSQSIAQALVACFKEAGGTLQLNHRITSVDELQDASLKLFDVTPRQLVALCGEHLPRSFRQRLLKFRYGPGIFKLDWTLDAPVPWASPACHETATLHLGGDFAELARSEAQVNQGQIPDRPYVLVAQPSLFDPTRTGDQRHTLWAYCHVPAQSLEDMTERVEAQIERFAPGFRKLIRARHAMNSADIERHNPNYIGGSISGGLMDWRQAFARPVLAWNPYRTPHPRIFLCSSSTPPGPGVHGMCGAAAARTALASLGRVQRTSQKSPGQ
ncbi:phytoene desaturase family protein [Oligoflexus tunisiensis]|uniref:phytoene desaturase family protein n=1 Tax=Oligoflexus tunisiensis TaxID=708132 RepID=UPI000A4C735D|nr:NAD(P)/FAD-dependent oxidoreductase [Oligoflexus tunisiensis]